ncbi:hypothetical protein FPANT_7108 [Fusarium pseudoanthophilum]|uniref:Uncharacterized protein n=1 Tax=Fusarium pseudoanthophilum TaxID=48495 RepID=A0A8H5L5L1_9HYPO|nr:hypothetical protein FPANT_7108 [Fusarium pseudoanthophilum]
MCSIVTINFHCKRCGKYLGNTVDERKCADVRRRGTPFHRRADRRTETYNMKWQECDDCQYEYEMYLHALQTGIRYPAPNPPFN